MYKKNKVENAIRNIVNEHSGGVKFTELIVEIVSKKYLDIKNPDEIEKVIREMEDVKILDYTWKSIDRAKMFVYTP